MRDGRPEAPDAAGGPPAGAPGPEMGAAWLLREENGEAVVEERQSAGEGRQHREEEPGPGAQAEPARQMVLRKYWMYTSDDDVLGEGSSSICHRGTEIASGERVAIKVYKKRPSHGRSDADVQLRRFRRQIEVLQDLQRPLTAPEDPALWCEQLARTPPSKIFMQLLDFSRDARGEPGADPEDGVMYVVTEMASYSLKDYLKLRRDQRRPLSRESVRTIARGIMLVTAGLHAKGLVHLDLKPENLMIFSGCLKLIDVDGCVKIGSKASINDSSLSFSPCYCAPEWAAFLIEDAEDPVITVTPGLDVWSVGMSICELVILDAALKPTYASFMRHGRSHREAGFLFMDWLSSLNKWTPPLAVRKFGDSDLLDLLTSWLLVARPQDRQSLAQSLSHPFVRNADLRKAKTGPLTVAVDTEGGGEAGGEAGGEGGGELGGALPAEAPRHRKYRLEDRSNKVLHKGSLWKLNEGGNPKDAKDWLRRDMWIAANGSLCYFSQKDRKRLVFLDSDHLSTAVIGMYEGGAREPAFAIKAKAETDDHDDPAPREYIFGCDTQEDYNAWLTAYETARTDLMRTMELGPAMAQELREFKMGVKNRRLKVGHDSEDYQPTFKSTLWKVRADGDRSKELDWFEREMWLSKNGSLVYWSKREEKELVYFSSSDLEHCTVVRIPNEESFKPWAFQVILPAADGVEFAPGEFAASSHELRERWVGELELLRGRAG